MRITMLLLIIISFKAYADKFEFEWSYLTKDSEKRIFSVDKDRKKQIDIFLASKPISFADLRDQMSPIRTQGGRETCSNFAVVGLVEHLIDKNADFSEQCLAFYSDPTDFGMIETKLSYILNNGINHESDCPYINPWNLQEWMMADDTKRKALKLTARNMLPDLSKANKIHPLFNVTEKHVDNFSDGEYLTYIQNQINNDIPVGAAFFLVGNEWATGLIQNIPSQEEIKKECENTVSLSELKKCQSHSVVLTGYDDNRRLIYFKNSWNKTWGLDENYALPSRGKRGIGYGAFSYAYLTKFRINSLVTISN